jgi:hypothetical protein
LHKKAIASERTDQVPRRKGDEKKSGEQRLLLSKLKNRVLYKVVMQSPRQGK